MQIRAWLAILAMALQALWPLIAQARPATLVPVCTVGGETHYVEIPAGGDASQHDHCAFCLAGAALPAYAAPSLGSAQQVAPGTTSFEEKSFSQVEADARSPPLLPMVLHNHNGRTHEEAVALRAARSDLGGGVLRFGVLHG